MRGGRRYGFEIKYVDAPTTTKSMHVVLKDLRLNHLWVIYPGDRGAAYRPAEIHLDLTRSPQLGREVHGERAIICVIASCSPRLGALWAMAYHRQERFPSVRGTAAGCGWNLGGRLGAGVRILAQSAGRELMTAPWSPSTRRGLPPGRRLMTTAYLDIETNWDRQITVIGIHPIGMWVKAHPRAS